MIWQSLIRVAIVLWVVFMASLWSASAPVFTIPSPGSDFAAQVTIPFDVQLAATGSPNLWSAVGLPPGLLINPATGEITGIPTLAGAFPTTISATNGAGMDVVGMLRETHRELFRGNKP